MIMTGKEDAPSRSARFKIVVVGTSGAGSRAGDARQARSKSGSRQSRFLAWRVEDRPRLNCHGERSAGFALSRTRPPPSSRLAWWAGNHPGRAQRIPVWLSANCQLLTYRHCGMVSHPSPSGVQVLKSKVHTWVRMPPVTCSASSALISRPKMRLRTLLFSVLFGIGTLLSAIEKRRGLTGERPDG